MDRNQSTGPDEAPELGEQTDVEAAEPLSSDDEPATIAEEKEPLGGTGGVGAGGAG